MKIVNHTQQDYALLSHDCFNILYQPIFWPYCIDSKTMACFCL